jgi:hypothetical protein
MRSDSSNRFRSESIGEAKMAQRIVDRNSPFPDLPIDAFLYGHEGPWPQPSRDHPFGLAPGIYQIPNDEWADWKKYVEAYYIAKAAPFGVKAGALSMTSAITTASDYPPMSDAEFTTLLSEGLYSKFLSPLDPRDAAVFKDYITATDRYDYWKSDYTCMRVVKETWPGEAAAASVVLIRRPKNDPEFAYEVVALILQVWDRDKQQFVASEILTPADGEAWRVARYFVLQGAIHRINLIDHTEIHFPSDTINAITKTVLPKDNLVLCLLQPHMWLTMPVNNTVLEGQRSLINRNTWYPWSPFVAKGDEVRKLLPFGWYGASYYAKEGAPDDPSKDAYFDAPNSSYPAYAYDPIPPTIPSRYGDFLNSYFAPVRKFARGVVEHMSEADWKEIGYWAHHIAIWIPGFPDREALLGADGKTPDKERLADTLAHFIWNASVRHSADHETLHEMIDGRRDANNVVVEKAKPVPFILRVAPPLKKNYTLQSMPVDRSKLTAFEWLEKTGEAVFRNTPLCWPADPLSAHWTDLLFYQPHNSRTLIEVGVDPDGNRNWNYAFKTPELGKLVAEFHEELKKVDENLAMNRPRTHFVPLAEIGSSIQF